MTVEISMTFYKFIKCPWHFQVWISASGNLVYWNTWWKRLRLTRGLLLWWLVHSSGSQGLDIWSKAKRPNTLLSLSMNSSAIMRPWTQRYVWIWRWMTLNKPYLRTPGFPESLWAPQQSLTGGPTQNPLSLYPPLGSDWSREYSGAEWENTVSINTTSAFKKKCT